MGEKSKRVVSYRRIYTGHPGIIDPVIETVYVDDEGNFQMSRDVQLVKPVAYIPITVHVANTVNTVHATNRLTTNKKETTDE